MWYLDLYLCVLKSANYLYETLKSPSASRSLVHLIHSIIFQFKHLSTWTVNNESTYLFTDFKENTTTSISFHCLLSVHRILLLLQLYYYSRSRTSSLRQPEWRGFLDEIMLYADKNHRLEIKTILFAEVDEDVWCLLVWLRCKWKIENIFIIMKQ